MTRSLGVLLAMFVCPVLAAPKLACTQDATRTYFCIDQNGITTGTSKHSDLRASRLYKGPPVGGVSDTEINLIVNCSTRIAVMQDLRGTNIGGGKASETEILRNLTRWICESPKPRPNPKLRQFGPG